MILINKTKNNEVSEVDIADDYLRRLKGLMFRKDVNRGLILKVPKSRYSLRSSIHTFFMRVSLDILFISSENKIQEMMTLKPWKIHVPKKPAEYIVELKKDAITTKNIEINDEVFVVDQCC